MAVISFFGRDDRREKIFNFFSLALTLHKLSFVYRSEQQTLLHTYTEPSKRLGLNRLHYFLWCHVAIEKKDI